MAYTGDQTRSDDIVQDVFIEILKRRAQLTNFKNFKAYLYVTTRNRCLNALKKASRERTRQLQPADENAGWRPNFLDHPSEYQMEGLIVRAMQQLSPQQRRVFELMRVGGKTRSEVATELGIADLTVRTHMNLALRTVRAFLQANLENGAWLIFFLFFLKK
jgi:RNA polymerase sigma factor (sigma-70 family)